MEHKSHEQLLSELELAKTKIAVGSFYTHYKHPDIKEYQIVDVGIFEKTEEVCIVYKSLHTGISWIRTIDNFLEEVEVEGKKVKRFKNVK